MRMEYEIWIYNEIWVSFNKVSMFGWQANQQREGGSKERGRTEGRMVDCHAVESEKGRAGIVMRML